MKIVCILIKQSNSIPCHWLDNFKLILLSFSQHLYLPWANIENQTTEAIIGLHHWEQDFQFLMAIR